MWTLEDDASFCCCKLCMIHVNFSSQLTRAFFPISNHRFSDMKSFFEWAFAMHLYLSFGRLNIILYLCRHMKWMREIVEGVKLNSPNNPYKVSQCIFIFKLILSHCLYFCCCFDVNHAHCCFRKSFLPQHWLISPDPHLLFSLITFYVHVAYEILWESSNSNMENVVTQRRR